MGRLINSISYNAVDFLLYYLKIYLFIQQSFQQTKHMSGDKMISKKCFVSKQNSKSLALIINMPAASCIRTEELVEGIKKGNYYIFVLIRPLASEVLAQGKVTTFGFIHVIRFTIL